MPGIPWQQREAHREHDFRDATLAGGYRLPPLFRVPVTTHWR